MRHLGSCHCGDLRWTLDSALDVEALPARACQCAFCRAHGALSTSDPAGELLFQARAPAAVIRYRFATRSADFLICARCGVYIGALMAEGGRWYAIANLNTLDAPSASRPRAQPMDYSGEDAGARRSRRSARWSPSRDLTFL